jgi:peroxiredoxin
MRNNLSPTCKRALSFFATTTLVLAVTLAFTDAGHAKDVTPLPLGATAPDFNLPGVDGKKHRLSDFQQAKVLVVIFTCNHCPTAQAYEDRIIKLHRDYADRGVAIVAISPNDPRAVRLDELGYTDVGDSLEDMKLRAEAEQFPFPYLYDGDTQQVSTSYGVLATPHVFIFDESRKLRYIGGFDDNERGTPKSQYARMAIEDLLAGREVARPKSRVFGCSTKWSDKRESARKSIERWNKEPVTLEEIDIDGVRKLAENKTDKYRLINVWATWCVPCVAELPELVTINRMYRKRPFELITISMNSSEEENDALQTLKQKRVAATNYIFTSEDREAFAEALDSQWQGPVPYTLLIAPGGEVIYRKLNSIDPLELKRAIVEQLGRTYK